MTVPPRPHYRSYYRSRQPGLSRRKPAMATWTVPAGHRVRGGSKPIHTCGGLSLI